MSPDSLPSTTPSFLAGRRKWAILVAVLLVLAAVAVAILRSPTATNTTSTTSTESVAGSVRVTNGSKNFQQVTTPLVADADKDGLPDQRETELKTNLRLADSDGDQLSDYDEVEVYGSDPLKQDSDNDGYPDGEEVRTGNNPTGPGSLLNLQQTISNINAQ